MVKFSNKVLKNSKRLWKLPKRKYDFKLLISEKNVSMYAGPPKIAQELFFWGYHLRVCSSYWQKYFVVEEHWYVQQYSSVRFWINDGQKRKLKAVMLVGSDKKKSFTCVSDPYRPEK